MTTDTVTGIHEGLSIITGIGMMILGYMKFREQKTTQTQKDNLNGLIELQELKLKIAVLEERLSAEMHLLDKLDIKLSALEREL